MPNRVSVIIPTYDRAHLVGFAVESVLAQEYPEVEVLVVDDGSSDDTASVIREFGDAVRYIRQDNRGAGTARNRALEVATGEYVAFLDSDDLWLDFKLGLQVEILDRLPEVGFLFSEFRILKDDGRIIHQGSRNWLQGTTDWARVYERRVPSDDLALERTAPRGSFDIWVGRLYAALLHEPYILPSTSVVRRACLAEEVRFDEDLRMYEDCVFFARLARRVPGAFMDVETTVNRGHDESGRLTRCSALQKHVSRLTVIERVWKADPEFMADHADEVLGLESEVYLRMARSALGEGKRALAKEALSAWRMGVVRRRRTLGMLLLIAALIPGVAAGARSAKRLLG